jgi:hypothetical protein
LDLAHLLIAAFPVSLPATLTPARSFRAAAELSDCSPHPSHAIATT